MVGSIQALAGDEMTDEIDSLVGELKQFDNPPGYELGHRKVEKMLAPVVQKIIQRGEAALDQLHALLSHEKTWSCSYALRILKEIRSEKSIPALVEFIRRTDESDYWDTGEDAMYALTAIGEPAVEPLLKEVKADIENRRFLGYMVGALTEIKDDRVYAFMADVIGDFLANEEKYRGWFSLELFVHDFGKQEKKEILPLLKRLLSLGLTEHERIEVIDAIEDVEDPERYEKETKEFAEKFIQEHLSPQSARRKVGRNDPCPCGSGKKYKRCCWLKEIGVGRT